MLKEDICEEEYKESSVVATFFLGEKELKKKEEKNKENTEESLESVPTSPLDPNWGERIACPLDIHVEALGGCCDRPVFSSAGFFSGRRQRTNTPIRVADNSDQVNRDDQSQTYQQAGSSC